MMKSFTFSAAVFLLLTPADSDLLAQTDFWEPAGLTGTGIFSLAINSSNHVFSGTDSSGIFRSTDEGDNWTEVLAGGEGFEASNLVINSNDHIFAVTTDGVYRSTDNGDSWTETGLTHLNVQDFAVNSSNDIFAGLSAGAYVTSGVFRSTDNGDNWTAINTGLTNTNIDALTVNSSDHIFAGTSDGVFFSNDNGDSWTQTVLTDVTVSALAINSSDHIFAGTWGGVYRSTDNGDSWTQILTMTQKYVTDFALNSTDHIFAGMMWDAGVFLSSDNGDSWTVINSGLTNLDVQALAINSNDYIFAGTSQGVFRSVDPTVDIIDEISDAIPLKFSLHQNYPNPFNPVTSLRYGLPERSYVTLTIYDILGRQVRNLVQGVEEPGYKSVTWDGTDDLGQQVSAGVYLYRIQAGDPSSGSPLSQGSAGQAGQVFSQTRKMILLR